MLEAMRSKTGGIVAKIFVFLIAFSFAIGGTVSLFSDRQSNDLATIGDASISVLDVGRAINRIIRNNNNSLNINMEEARNFGLDRIALQNLASSLAISEEMANIGVNIPDEAIFKYMAELNPEIRDGNKVLSAADIRRIIEVRGHSEQSFLAEMKSSILSKALVGSINAPQEMLKAQFAFENEIREAQYITMPAVSEDGLVEPTDKELQQVYASNKNNFIVPELRSFSFLKLEPKDLVNRVEVTEEEVKSAYEFENNKPEVRSIKQLTFDSMDDAIKAKQEISSGVSFESVAQKKGLKKEDYDLGELTREQVVDPKISKVAFSLNKGEVSEPISGDLSIAIVQVDDIHQDSPLKTYSEARASIKQRLLLDRAADLIYDVIPEIEDARGAGSDLATIAQQFGLSVINIEEISADGRDSKNKKVKSIENIKNLLPVVFESELGEVGQSVNIIIFNQSNGIERQREGAAWVDIKKIMPERQKSFAEVKDQVIGLWKEQEIRRIGVNKAKDLVHEIRAGKDFSNVATALGLEVKETGKVKRNSKDTNLSVIALYKLFEARKDEVGYAIGDANKMQIFKIIDIGNEAFVPNSKFVEQNSDQIANNLRIEIFEQYKQSLANKYELKVNDAMWQRLPEILSNGR